MKSSIFAFFTFSKNQTVLTGDYDSSTFDLIKSYQHLQFSLQKHFLCCLSLFDLRLTDYPLVSSNCFFLCYSNCTEIYKTGFSVKLSVNYRYLAKIYTVVIQLILNNILFYISWRCQEDTITNMTNSSRLSQKDNVRKYSYIHAICFSSVYNTLII
jgi:hypothetical protein